MGGHVLLLGRFAPLLRLLQRLVIVVLLMLLARVTLLLVFHPQKRSATEEPPVLQPSTQQTLNRSIGTSPSGKGASLGYTNAGCTCVMFGLNTSDTGLHERGTAGQSTCSDFATQRGPGQKVVSLSSFNPDPLLSKDSLYYKKYLMPVFDYAKSLDYKYPGWRLRLYHNASTEDRVATMYHCKLFCSFNNVDMCDVNNLPTLGALGQRQQEGRLWRLAVLGDPTVERFLIRDVDSFILDREIAAVKEWEASERGFHVIRDHPMHGAPIVPGLFGGRNDKVAELSKIRDDLLSQTLNGNERSDESLLATLLWPHIKNDTMQHDAYYCQWYPGAVPFPTQRDEDGLYCGWGLRKPKLRTLLQPVQCPEECRPAQHPTWTKC